MVVPVTNQLSSIISSQRLFVCLFLSVCFLILFSYFFRLNCFETFTKPRIKKAERNENKRKGEGEREKTVTKVCLFVRKR